MANRWALTEEIKNKFKPILEKHLEKIEALTAEETELMNNEELGIDFYQSGLCPYHLRLLMEELGYEVIDSDDNGWELDFWIYMKRKDEKVFPSGCERMVIRGCGMTFELVLHIEDRDFF